MDAFKKLRVELIIALLAISLITNGQSGKLDLEFQSSSDLCDYNSGEKQLMGVDGEYFCFLAFDNLSSEKTFEILKINTKTNKRDYKKLVLPDFLLISDLGNRFDQMSFYDDKMYVLGYRRLLIFQLKDDSYTFLKEIQTDMHFQQISVLNAETLLLTDYYNNHPLTGDDRIKVYSLKWNSEELSRLLSMESVGGIEFSHLVNSYITCHNDLIAVADPLDYNVTIYKILNDSMKMSSELSLKNDLNAKLIYDSLIQPRMPQRNNVKLQLEFIDSNFKANCGRRIEKIYFLDSSNLFISVLNHCKREEREVYVWTHFSDEWKLTSSNLNYSLNYTNHYGDRAGLQFSTPIFFIDGKLFQLSYLQNKSIKKTKEFGYFLNSHTFEK